MSRQNPDILTRQSQPVSALAGVLPNGVGAAEIPLVGAVDIAKSLLSWSSIGTSTPLQSISHLPLCMAQSISSSSFACGLAVAACLGGDAQSIGSCVAALGLCSLLLFGCWWWWAPC